LIIERVTGEDYFDYIVKNIYEPAGMINTDAYETDRIIPNCAVGYTTFGAEPGTVMNNLFMHVVKGGPAGGGYSTIEDLLNFSIALLGHKLLTPEFTQTAITGKVDVDMNSKYACGFRERFENGHRIVGHGGGFPGISSNLSMYTDLGYTVAILSNTDQGSQAVKVFIEELLVGKTQYTKNIELTDAVLGHLTEHGYEAGVEYFEKERDGGTVNENSVNRYGYELLTKGNTAGAIAVFRFNAYLYPESSNVYDSLGEAYMTAGETRLAIENYERSLKLDAQNTNAVEMLEKLKQK
jgi:D-alanyl-D-alanine carboxypeptidase